MPRIYNQYGEPMDFCKRHFPTEAVAEKKYSNSNGGVNPDDPNSGGYGYDAEHPDYEGECYEEDGKWHSDYTCEVCKCVLRDRDN